LSQWVECNYVTKDGGRAGPLRSRLIPLLLHT
jgi:hypothetical protein